MMTRMERATAAWALALARRRAILEYHSPTKVTVRRRRRRPALGIRVVTPWPFLPAGAWGPDWRADMMPPRRVVVCLEVTPKQAVASALDWPGWCRADRDEGGALAALASCAGPYAPVAGHARASFPRPRSPSMSSSGCPAGPRPRSPHPNAAARSRSDRQSRAGDGDPGRRPPPGRPSHRGLGGLRRD